MRQSLFFKKVAGLRPATLLKKRLWHRCFPANFAKFLRTCFLQNISWRLLLPNFFLHYLSFKMKKIIFKRNLCHYSNLVLIWNLTEKLKNIENIIIITEFEKNFLMSALFEGSKDNFSLKLVLRSLWLKKSQ